MKPAALKRITFTRVLLIAAFVLYALHFYMTKAGDFAYDMFTGHQPYIKSIYEKWTIPASYECWECNQPPLYYLLGALFYAAGDALGLKEPIEAVRWLSFAFYAGFIYFAVRLLREWVTFKPKPAYCLALALVLFWPIGVTKASLVNNDIPLMLCEMAGFYYLMRWWKNPKRQQILKSLAWTAFSVQFKSSGFVMFAVIALVVFYRWHKTRIAPSFLPGRHFSLMIVLLALLAALPFARVYYDERIASDRHDSLWVPGVSIINHSGLRVNEDFSYYVTFDYKTYFKEPFYHAWRDETGRQYFWNTLLKSSLFGEFVWKSPGLAKWLSLGELLMLLYVGGSLWGAVVLDKTRRADWMPFVMCVGLHVAMMLAYRTQYPFSCSQDYRYIFAVTPVMALLYAKSLAWQHERGQIRLYGLGYVLGWLFVGGAIAFVLLQELG